MRPVLPSVCALVCLSACYSAPTPVDTAGIRTMTTQRDWSFLALGPSDVVRVTVVGHPEMSSVVDGVRVDPQGMIFLPMVGAQHVAGKTVTTVNAELNEAYARYLKTPRVVAEVLDYKSRSYYVLGQVAEPGAKTMDRPLNALEACATGGAFMRGADRESVFLLRPHDDRLEVHEFNLKQPGADGLVQVLPGDIVYIRQTGYEDFQEDLLPILAGLGYPAFQLGLVTAD